MLDQDTTSSTLVHPGAFQILAKVFSGEVPLRGFNDLFLVHNRPSAVLVAMLVLHGHTLGDGDFLQERGAAPDQFAGFIDGQVALEPWTQVELVLGLLDDCQPGATR